MAPLPVLPVDQRRVLRDAVVPHHDRALLPLDARLEVGAVREVVVQELEQRVRLFLLEADDVAGDCVVRGVSYGAGWMDRAGEGEAGQGGGFTYTAG